MINLFLAASELMNETDGGRNAQYLFVAPQLSPAPLAIHNPPPPPLAHPAVAATDSTVFAGFAKNSPSPDSETGQKVAVFSYN